MLVFALEIIRKAINWFIATTLIFTVLLISFFICSFPLTTQILWIIAGSSFIVAVIYPVSRYPIKDWVD